MQLRESYFNSRPCGRGDLAVLTDCTKCLVFQFTPLREGRLPHPYISGSFSLISIHAPAGGATSAHGLMTAADKFQFTPLREGRPIRSGMFFLSGNFNSRPCGRGDARHPALYRQDERISIHAPAGGATERGFTSGSIQTISIHAPAGGATLSLRKKASVIVFQFTPLREGRPRRSMMQLCPS